MHDWQGLARDALETLGDGVHRQGFPTWLRIYADPDEEVGLRVEASSGATGLLGWSAPEDCIAVGVVATGKARTQGGSTGDGSGTPTGDGIADRFHDAGETLPLRMACVVSRDRGLGWWMELPDGSSYCDPPSAGRMLDVLLCCLGLPTAPPEQPAADLHAAAWLASVIDGGLSSDRRLTWSDVERLHPLARVLAGDVGVRIRVADDDGLAQEELDDLLRIAAAACSWREIRAQAANGELAAFIDAELAGWMDDGMFSRWILSAVPEIEQLLEAARPLLVPSAARRLAHEVRRAPVQPARSASG